MNIEEYISSGVLESYVLGELSASEIQEVEQMAAKHSEIKEEINQIELSLEKLAFKTAIDPMAGVNEARVQFKLDALCRFGFYTSSGFRFNTGLYLL